MCNQALRDNNISGQIDHRSYESQGINQLGSVHLGPSAYQQIMLSATLATEQDQAQTQFAVAAAMAKGTEQLLNVLNSLEHFGCKAERTFRPKSYPGEKTQGFRI